METATGAVGTTCILRPRFRRRARHVAVSDWARDYYVMDDRTSLFTPHHGEAARLHKQAKSELRLKRRAEWKQLQISNGTQLKKDSGGTGRP